jgi:choline kinase
MKVVILAAGIASRLRPLTNNTPKCLLKVGNKRILEQTIENLIANNLTDIIVVTGYLENQIREYLHARFPSLNIEYIYNEVYASTNNIYSLGLVREAVGEEPMLMMDSDIVFDHRIITELLKSGYENCLALKRHAVQDEEIKIKIDERGRVLEISKEVKTDEAIGESIGIELFSKTMKTALFNVIDRKVRIDGKFNQFYEAAFQELIDHGYDLFAVDTTRYLCMEIDTPDDLRIAGELLLKT